MRSSVSMKLKEVMMIALVLVALSTVAPAQRTGPEDGDEQPGPTQAAKKSRLYQGTVGTHPIVLEITPSGDEMEGRYFYKRIGKTIRIGGRRVAGGAFRAQEYHEGKLTGAEWWLTMGSSGAGGVFCRCDASQMPTPGTQGFLKISLTPALRSATYEKLIVDYPLQAGPEIRVSDEIGYDILSDPRFPDSRASYPHLTRFPDMGVMAKINQSFGADLQQSRISASTWLEGDGNNGKIFYDTYHIGLVNRDIFSMVFHIKLQRASDPYPVESAFARFYNLRKGWEYDIRDFFLDPDDVQSDESSEYAKVAEGTGGNALQEEFLKLYLKHYGKPDEGCGDLKAAIEHIRKSADHPIVYLETTGLSIEYEEVSGPGPGCGHARIVPYPEIAYLVKRDSMLHYLVEKRP